MPSFLSTWQGKRSGVPIWRVQSRDKKTERETTGNPKKSFFSPLFHCLQPVRVSATVASCPSLHQLQRSLMHAYRRDRRGKLCVAPMAEGVHPASEGGLTGPYLSRRSSDRGPNSISEANVSQNQGSQGALSLRTLKSLSLLAQRLVTPLSTWG